MLLRNDDTYTGNFVVTRQSNVIFGDHNCTLWSGKNDGESGKSQGNVGELFFRDLVGTLPLVMVPAVSWNDAVVHATLNFDI